MQSAQGLPHFPGEAVVTSGRAMVVIPVVMPTITPFSQAHHSRLIFKSHLTKPYLREALSNPPRLERAVFDKQQMRNDVIRGPRLPQIPDIRGPTRAHLPC